MKLHLNDPLLCTTSQQAPPASARRAAGKFSGIHAEGASLSFYDRVRAADETVPVAARAAADETIKFAAASNRANETVQCLPSPYLANECLQLRRAPHSAR